MRVRLVASLAVALALLAAPATAGAASFLPPGGQVYWGGQGGYSAAHIGDFEHQSGKHPAVFNYFISWRATEPALHWLSFRLADTRARNTAAMLSVSPEDTGLSPRDLARGRGCSPSTAKRPSCGRCPR